MVLKAFFKILQDYRRDYFERAVTIKPPRTPVRIAVKREHFDLPCLSWPKALSDHAGIGASIEVSAEAEIDLCELSDDRKCDHHGSDRAEMRFGAPYTCVEVKEGSTCQLAVVRLQAPEASGHKSYRPTQPWQANAKMCTMASAVEGCAFTMGSIGMCDGPAHLYEAPADHAQA
jgi:hypothetical protein